MRAAISVRNALRRVFARIGLRVLPVVVLSIATVSSLRSGARGLAALTSAGLVVVVLSGLRELRASETSHEPEQLDGDCDRCGHARTRHEQAFVPADRTIYRVCMVDECECLEPVLTRVPGPF